MRCTRQCVSLIVHYRAPVPPALRHAAFYQRSVLPQPKAALRGFPQLYHRHRARCPDESREPNQIAEPTLAQMSSAAPCASRASESIDAVSPYLTCGEHVALVNNEA
jgi:hypothetical protein